MFKETDFMKGVFSRRTKEVQVPELAHFFDDPKEAVWTVQSLEGEEIALANAAAQKNASLLNMAAAIAGKDGQEKIEAFKEMFGVQSEATPTDIIRRKELLVHGSVSPKCSEELAVKLAKVYPTVFYLLTQTITELTGLGHTPGKHKGSGKTSE